jgi:hypothetical protein
MNRRLDSHLFWGQQSPLSALSGAALIIMASSRFAFALICAATLIWVFGLSALVYSGARQLMPSKGKRIILLFLSVFFCGFFMLLMGFLNPLLILGAAFFLVLVPPCCLSTGFFEAAESADTIDAVSRAILEAVTLGGTIIAIALIREPLGIGTISIPVGAQGITELFDSSEANTFIPVRLFSVSAGGLLLLGYCTAMYRYFREQYGSVQEERE